jgi:2-iminobutanoate/2-iminopropanoate deaminase
MTDRVSIGGLPVGGTEPLIATAVGWGDLPFLSGRAPIDKETLRLSSVEFEDQARHVLEQCVEALAEAGSEPEHVLREQCYLLDGGNVDAWNRLWAEYFPAPRPVRTTIVTGFMFLEC